MTTTDPHPWPRLFQNGLDAPVLERKSWQRAIAPQWIGLLLWVAYFDQLPAVVLGRSSLLWPVGGALVAGWLSYLLLYKVPATWGQRTGRPLGVVAARTFGVAGATWIPGVLLALAQVVWLAIAIDYGTRLALFGLEMVGLLDPSFRRPVLIGGAQLPGYLFLVLSLLWCLAVAFTGRFLVRVIAALMSVYPVLPALMLGTTAAIAMKTLPDYRVAMVAIDSKGGPAAGWSAAADTVQMIFAFLSAAALFSVDWGTVARDEKDVRTGGWVGVAFGSWVIATLSILSVAGAYTRMGLDNPGAPRVYESLTFVRALQTLIGGRTAGGMLITFSLTALAPGCYAAFVLSDRLNVVFPRLSRSRWTFVAVALAWLLIAFGGVSRLFPVYTLVGAVFAPICGALAADYVRSRGGWGHPRAGWNGPGVLAWAVGLVFGLVPLIGPRLGNVALASFQPAAVVAFIAAFVTYSLLALLGRETPQVETVGPVESLVPGQAD